jgi:hypothetical protein
MADEKQNNVGDRRQVKDRKVLHRLRREREIEKLGQMLKDKDNRAFVWRILERCGVYQTSFTGNDATTNFNEGKRQIGLMILEELAEVDPSAFSLMQQEAKANG